MDTPKFLKNKTTILLVVAGTAVGLILAYRSKSGYVKKALLGLGGGLIVGFGLSYITKKPTEVSKSTSEIADDMPSKVESVINDIAAKSKEKPSPEKIKKAVDSIIASYKTLTEKQKAMFVEMIGLLDEMSKVDKTYTPEANKAAYALTMKLMGQMQELEAKYGAETSSVVKKIFDTKLNSSFCC